MGKRDGVPRQGEEEEEDEEEERKERRREAMGKAIEGLDSEVARGGQGGQGLNRGRKPPIKLTVGVLSTPSREPTQGRPLGSTWAV